MKLSKTLFAGAGITIAAIGIFAKDPVIMTVNGVDVPKSEFEYLYTKNSSQQLTQQPLEEYLELFKLYKLKVEEARQAGIDTTAAFRREMDQFRHDLAAPYMNDSVYLNKLAEEAYKRMGEEVEAQHIMLFKTPNPSENGKLRAQLDSIRTRIAGGEDFSEMARKYSQDRGSSANGGKMGYITAMQYPYYFELAAYNTPVGSVSEIVESPVGYHILLGGKHKPADGKVKASHILTLTQGKDAAGQARAKALIDSIYNVAIADPTQFAQLATKYSEDPGSARNGGELPLFGHGQMVPEFDSVAFALNVGEISAPFRTSYGWHIISKTGKEGIAPFAKLKPGMIARITNPQDERSELVRANQNVQLAKRNKGKMEDKTIQAISNHIAKNGIDSLLISTYTGAKATAPLFRIGKTEFPAGEFFKVYQIGVVADPVQAQKDFDKALRGYYNAKLVKAEQDRLYATNSTYRNLLNEYIDGSMLYEISVKNIWDRAAKDQEGLQAFFEANRDNYKWSAPHAKGYLVQAANDSIANEVRNLAASKSGEALVSAVRKQFGGKAVIEKVLAEKGQNTMVDFLLFNGANSTPARKNLPVFFMINGKVLEAPESYEDVKGTVTGDYQNELQAAWERELLSKYPVKVNEKVLRKVKRL